MTKTLEEMSVFEQSRWYALLEAVDIISQRCEERGVDFETLHLSPIGIEKYVESTCDIYAQKIQADNAMKHLPSILFIQPSEVQCQSSET